MNGTDGLTLTQILLPAWLATLVFVFLASIGILFFPRIHARIVKGFLPILFFPSLVVMIGFIVQGLETSDRPIVHWIFHKEIHDSLRLGFLFDPVTLVISVVIGAVLVATSLRNRPPVTILSALGLGWVSVSLVASSKTFWTAALALGIGIIAKVVPILGGKSDPDPHGTSIDSLWMSSTKRSWIGLLVTLVGAAGLAAHGLHLDFFSEGTWTDLYGSPNTLIAGSFFLAGLLLQFLPMATSAIYHWDRPGFFEEENFIFETAMAWVSVLIIYRVLPNIRDTHWATGVQGAAMLCLAGSFLGLAFLETRRAAISFWLSNYPLFVLTILPALHGQAAFLFLAGSIVAFGGLFICLDHQKTRVDLGLAVFFFLGMFGFTGWATSLGTVEFFSRFEEAPVLVSLTALIWLIYAAFGFRIVLRGGDTPVRTVNLAKWITSGFLITLGFGPALSGRWSSGAIPEVSDWLDGAKDWPWIKPYAAETITTNWLGFGLVHGILLVGILLGIFVWATAKIFPFSENYPKGLRAARGVFGGDWLHRKWIDGLTKTGTLWAEKISDPVWERWLPQLSKSVLARLQRLGEWVEDISDHLTSARYAHLFSAPSKLVQWLHGGNVRLYAWFALGWILIISLFLTR